MMRLDRGKNFILVYMGVGLLILLLIIESFLAVYRKHQTTVVEQQKRQLGAISSVGADYVKTYMEEKNLEIQNMFTFKKLGHTPKQTKQQVEGHIKLYWNQSPLYLDYMKYFELGNIENVAVAKLSSEEFKKYVDKAIKSNELIVGPWRQINFYLHGNKQGLFLKEEEERLKGAQAMLTGYSIAHMDSLNLLVTAKLPYYEINQPIRITFYLLIVLSIGVIAIFAILTYLVFRMRKRKLEYTMDLKLQEQIHQENRNETIGFFSRKIAHEYNNLLAPIMMYCELINEELKPSDDVLKEYVNEIYHSCEECTKMAKDLLEYGRSMPTGHTEVPYDSVKTIKDTIKRIQLILPEQIKLQSDLSSEPIFLLGNPMELVQILYNLCINSIHAMERGGTLTIKLEEIEKEAILTVKDTGSGIPKHLQKKLFVAQFTTKTEGKGNGLGLSIVASIIEKYKGRVVCTSKEGVGTIFTIHFPTYNEKVNKVT